MAAPVYYHDYLHLDELLSTQQPLTDAQNEMLFIWAVFGRTDAKRCVLRSAGLSWAWVGDLPPTR